MVSDEEYLHGALQSAAAFGGYRINLKGESMRNRAKKLTTPDTSD